MDATLTYIGRILALEPAVLGAQFESELAITLRETKQVLTEDGFRTQQVETPQHTTWYDNHPVTGVQRFFTFSGFGARIAKKLRKQGYTVNEVNLLPTGLETPDFSKLDGIQWRGSQMEVFITMLAAQCGQVICPTGWGKTFLIRLLAKVYPKAVIVFTVPVKEVALDIWHALREYDSTVGIVGAGKHKRARLTVAVTHSLKHCDKNANLVLGDELHALVSPSFRETLVQFPRAKFIGFTATPEGRADGGDMYIEALFGPRIADVPYQEAVDSRNVVPITVLVVQSNNGFNVSQIENKATKDRHGLWTNHDRNALIARTARYVEQQLQDPDLQMLIMVDKTEHAYWLQQALPDFVVVTGDVDAERAQELQASGAFKVGQKLCTKEDRKAHKARFEKRELKKVIATMVWSKGVNFLDLNVLIRADGLRSPISSGQVPGRLSRLGSDGNKARGILVDFNDTFSPDLAMRSKERFKVYKSNGWKIVPITPI